MNTINIDKGINVHFIETCSDTCAPKFSTAVICILIRSKLNRSDATKTAVIPSVLQNGSQKYKTIIQINTALEDIYGAVYELQIIKKGEEQIIQFYIEFAGIDGKFDSNAELAAEFLCEIMLRPILENGGFTNENTEIGKRSLKNMIESRINNKAEYTKLRCVEEMCAEEPFGIYADGYLQDLDELNGLNIYSHYIKLLLTSPIEFIITADVNRDKFIKKIETLFVNELHMLGRSSNQADFIIPRAEICAGPDKEKSIEERLVISQGKVCMGFRCGVDPVSEDYYNLLLFNELLGGSANSKLFADVREKRNLCYYVNSFVYRFKSIIIVQSGVDSLKISEFTQTVSNHIKEISDPYSIDDADFDNAKKSLIMKFKSIQDNQNYLIEFYLSQYLLLDRADLDTVIKIITNISKEAVAKIAVLVKPDTVFKLTSSVGEC